MDFDFKVEYWNDERCEWSGRWFNSKKDAMLCVERLKDSDKISSIRVSQILYELER